jgi:hypothetical protein
MAPILSAARRIAALAARRSAGLAVRPALAVALALGAGAAHAEPGYYVVTAYPNEGQRSIDFRYWTVRHPDRPAVVWPEIGFGYGVTSRWYTELYASWVGSLGSTRLETVNWQNEYLLTQGEYPFDLALHAMLTHNAIDPGYAIEYGPALQTEVGRLQLNGNLFFERAFGADPGAQLKYQWQARYHGHPLANLGAQGFGELGAWNHWAPRDRQSHRAGPALFGTLALGQGRALLYQASFLVGQIWGRHGEMFSMRVQYTY